MENTAIYMTSILRYPFHSLHVSPAAAPQVSTSIYHLSIEPVALSACNSRSIHVLQLDAPPRMRSVLYLSSSLVAYPEPIHRTSRGTNPALCDY